MIYLNFTQIYISVQFPAWSHKVAASCDGHSIPPFPLYLLVVFVVHTYVHIDSVNQNYTGNLPPTANGLSDTLQDTDFSISVSSPVLIKLASTSSNERFVERKKRVKFSGVAWIVKQTSIRKKITPRCACALSDEQLIRTLAYHYRLPIKRLSKTEYDGSSILTVCC